VQKFMLVKCMKGMLVSKSYGIEIDRVRGVKLFLPNNLSGRSS
jgi:hypothetical protein